jgi:hypothetical protein
MLSILVFLLGIFRRAPHPSDTRGRPCALFLPRGALPQKNSLKKNLLVIYDTSKFFLVRRKLPFFWPKLLPALFLKKPRYPCPFEILAETLNMGESKGLHEPNNITLT